MACTCVHHVLKFDIKAPSRCWSSVQQWLYTSTSQIKKKKTLLPLRWESLNRFWRAISTQGSADSLSSAEAAAFIVQIRFTGFLPAITSLLTLLMCILLDAKGWTHKKYRMAFQRCDCSYKTVTLHWVKTKIDICNSIPGIFCCLYKFPQLIKLYGIHPDCLWFFSCFLHTAESIKIQQLAINVILSLSFEYILQVSWG